MVADTKELTIIAPQKEEEFIKLAVASVVDGSIQSALYSPWNAVSSGVVPEKLIIPREYHSVISLCYDFYQRGGVVSTVVNRLTELSITEVINGQKKTTDEANAYFDAVLHRNPSRLYRFLRQASLEYFLSGLVLPRIDWEEIPGSELSPDLKAARMYKVPVFDLYPPKLVKVEWGAAWGKKEYYLKIPSKDLKLIKGGSKVKDQQRRIDAWVANFPTIVEDVRNGAKYVKLDTDAILRKEVSVTEYPTPFLFNVLESLTYKQQLRKMDFSVASRVINAILLIQEGDKDFPAVADAEGNSNIDTLKAQIYARTNDPRMMERLFMLFSNHTTKLTWITPDVEAMLSQNKYDEVNNDIAEGLGFAKILVTGESRNSQASEVSTWAIQPMMEELRQMLMEWVGPVYEEAAELNGFRNTPVPEFTPIRLQDFIKTAAVFAQLFKEGNISRMTRDRMAGINFESEIELMKDEKELMDELPKTFPGMPYNVMAPPGMGGAGGGIGRPAGNPNTGGRPRGSQNVPVNNRNRGVKPKGQSPTSRVAAESIDFQLMDDEELLELFNTVAEERGLKLGPEDI